MVLDYKIKIIEQAYQKELEAKEKEIVILKKELQEEKQKNNNLLNFIPKTSLT